MATRMSVRRARRLVEQNSDLRAQLAEAEQLLYAIRHGDMDALVVEGPDGPQIFTLQSVERIYRVLVETMNEGAATLHPSGTVLYANRYLASLLGVPLEQLIGASFTRFVPPESEPRIAQLISGALASPTAGDARLKAASEQLISVRLSLHALNEGSATTVCMIVTDLSEHEHARTSLQQALEQKNVLLREIHHRVKNNLQVITSLLRLQASTLADLRLSSAFQDSLNRIRAMALVHEQLYASSDLAAVSAETYLQTLTTSILRSSGLNLSQRLNCNIDPAIQLSVDMAMPLGLIVSELVANSLKHGFADGRAGQIHVHLSQEQTELRLTVRDDGIGLPINFDPERATTLGLRIVRTLARQLGGSLAITTDNGTVVEVTIASGPHTTTPYPTPVHPVQEVQA